MSLLTFVLAAILIVAGVVQLRPRGHLYPLAFTAVVLSFVGIWVLTRGQARALFVPWLDIPLALHTALGAADAFGSPDPLARALGVGFHRREWEYDRRLTKAIKPFGRTQNSDNWPVVLRSAVAGLRRLRAPDAAWGQLAADYADAYDAWVKLHLEGDYGRAPEVVARVEALHDERDRLRAIYRAKAEREIAGSRAARFWRRW